MTESFLSKGLNVWTWVGMSSHQRHNIDQAKSNIIISPFVFIWSNIFLCMFFICSLLPMEPFCYFKIKTLSLIFSGTKTNSYVFTLICICSFEMTKWAWKLTRFSTRMSDWWLRKKVGRLKNAMFSRIWFSSKQLWNMFYLGSGHIDCTC